MGFPVTNVTIVASIATIIIVSAVADVAMLTRPPEPPIRTELHALLRGLRDALGSAHWSAPPRPRRSRQTSKPFGA
eukprot:4342872-Pyramimonas_sp.AAC.1